MDLKPWQKVEPLLGLPPRLRYKSVPWVFPEPEQFRLRGAEAGEADQPSALSEK